MPEPLASRWRASPAAAAAWLTRARPEPFLVPRHIAHLDRIVAAAVLDGAKTGRGARVLVQMPPGHGKSTYCSTWLPAWYLSLWPQRHVISTANTTLLAERNGRSVRDVVAEYGQDLGVSLRSDTTAASRWLTDGGGGLFGAGVGTALPGWRAHLIGIDDPHGGLEEVRSAVQRENVWEWYVGSLRNRLEPGGTIVLLLTRWHEDDLAGRLLRKAGEGGEHWTVVSLPAIAEAPADADLSTWTDEIGRGNGEALWPERWPADALRAQAAGSSYVWSALFQQDPHDEEGGMFPRAVLEAAIVPDWPAPRARPIRYWDKAATKHQRAVNEYPQTAGVKAGMVDGVLYLVEVEAFQEDPPGVERRLRATAERDGRSCRVWIEQEPGSAGVDDISHFQRFVLPRHAVEGHRPGTNKETRADALASRFRNGTAKLVRGSWTHAFIEEASKFPTGRRKDQIDAASGALAVLVERGGPSFLELLAREGYGKRDPRERYPRVGNPDRDVDAAIRGLGRTAGEAYDRVWGRTPRPW